MSDQICDEVLLPQDSRVDSMVKLNEVSSKKKGGIAEIMRSDDLFGSGPFGEFSSGNSKHFTTNNIGHVAYNQGPHMSLFSDHNWECPKTMLSRGKILHKVSIRI